MVARDCPGIPPATPRIFCDREMDSVLTQLADFHQSWSTYHCRAFPRQKETTVAVSLPGFEVPNFRQLRHRHHHLNHWQRIAWGGAYCIINILHLTWYVG